MKINSGKLKFPPTTRLQKIKKFLEDTGDPSAIRALYSIGAESKDARKYAGKFTFEDVNQAILSVKKMTHDAASIFIEVQALLDSKLKEFENDLERNSFDEDLAMVSDFALIVQEKCEQGAISHPIQLGIYIEKLLIAPNSGNNELKAMTLRRHMLSLLKEPYSRRYRKYLKEMLLATSA